MFKGKRCRCVPRQRWELSVLRACNKHGVKSLCSKGFSTVVPCNERFTRIKQPRTQKNLSDTRRGGKPLETGQRKLIYYMSQGIFFTHRCLLSLTLLFFLRGTEGHSYRYRFMINKPSERSAQLCNDCCHLRRQVGEAASREAAP